MNPPAKPVTLARLGKLLLFSLLAFYLLICVLMTAFQRSFIYHPAVYTPSQVDAMARSANLERWTNSSGQDIGFKRLSPKQPSGGTVLLTYGNGNTAIGSAHYAEDIQKAAPFDVFILEYPGYEDRPGSPSQRSLFRAADDAFLMLPTNKPIYLVGESLGTGVASYLAGTYSNKISGVVLISPFNNLPAVAQNHYPLLPARLLLVDHFPSETYLKNYHGRMGMTVDGKDVVVPEKFGLALYDSYNGPKKLWKFPGGSHCQITEPQKEFWNEVIEFWQTHTISSSGK